MSDLIAWQGGNRPVPRLTVVEAHFRGKALGPMVSNAARFTWQHDPENPDRDIVAYSIVRPASDAWRQP